MYNNRQHRTPVCERSCSVMCQHVGLQRNAVCILHTTRCLGRALFYASVMPMSVLGLPAPSSHHMHIDSTSTAQLSRFRSLVQFQARRHGFLFRCRAAPVFVSVQGTRQPCSRGHCLCLTMRPALILSMSWCLDRCRIIWLHCRKVISIGCLALWFDMSPLNLCVCVCQTSALGSSSSSSNVKREMPCPKNVKQVKTRKDLLEFRIALMHVVSALLLIATPLCCLTIDFAPRRLLRCVVSQLISLLIVIAPVVPSTARLSQTFLWSCLLRESGAQAREVGADGGTVGKETAT